MDQCPNQYKSLAFLCHLKTSGLMCFRSPQGGCDTSSCKGDSCFCGGYEFPVAGSVQADSFGSQHSPVMLSTFRADSFSGEKRQHPRPIFSTVSETLTSVGLLKTPVGFKLPSVVVSEKAPHRLVEDSLSGQWEQSKCLWAVC